MGRWLARAALVALCLLLALALRPLASFGDGWGEPAASLFAGFVFALLALAAEYVLRSRDIWTVAGAAIGVLVGGLVGVVVVMILPDGSGALATAPLRPFLYLIALYAGGFAGAR